MTDAEQREAARQFVNRWMGKGKEDEDGRSYWIDLLTNVLGMDNVTERLNFEKKVVIDGNTKRIDVYIPETRVIIEQKSLGKALDQKIRNSGDVDLTPFEQADRYNGKLTFDERARWIVTSNFAEIWIYDMNQKQPEPTKIALDELQSKYPLLDFLVKKEVKTISHEMEVSIKAGDIVGLYDTGNFQIGDSIYSGKRKIVYPALPEFTPELFMRVTAKNVMKQKSFHKGMNQLVQEGAIQLYRNYQTDEYILGAVGQLQFEVFQFRMKNEYNSEVEMNSIGHRVARWIDPEQLDPQMSNSRNLLVKDRYGNPLFLFENEFAERFFRDKYPDIKLTEKL